MKTEPSEPMVKKWAISDKPPIKMRLVKEVESIQDTERLIDRPPRVRVVSRIVKCLAAIGLLSAASWLQAAYHGERMACSDGPHEAIGDDTINLL